MSALAAQLMELVRKITSEPWPATTAARTPWATRVGLPARGTQISETEQEGGLAFTAPSLGGRVYWDLTPTGGLAELSLIHSTLEQGQFNGLRADAEALRESLDQTAVRVDGDVKGASWRAEWRAGYCEVELYWSDPNRDQPPVDAALHLAFSPVDASPTPPQNHWEIGLSDSTGDLAYAQQSGRDSAPTMLRIVRFVDTHRAVIGSATVCSLSDIGVTGHGQDATTARTFATTMAINLAGNDASPTQIRAQLEDALTADRWDQVSTVEIDGHPIPAWAKECRPGLWSLYALWGALVVAAALRSDPKTLTLQVTTAVAQEADTTVDGLQAVEVDERDSSWEVHSPTFRVYIHDSSPDTTHGATATYDITDADALQATDWAQHGTAPGLVDTDISGP